MFQNSKYKEMVAEKLTPPPKDSNRLSQKPTSSIAEDAYLESYSERFETEYVD